MRFTWLIVWALLNALCTTPLLAAVDTGPVAAAEETATESEDSQGGETEEEPDCD